MATEKQPGIATQQDHVSLVRQGGDALGLNQAAVCEELLLRCALKDEKAFAELYRQFSPKLFAIALRITSRGDWAEEVLQESFVNVWQHAGGYHAARGAPMTWMTTIVRNRAIDWRRRHREGKAEDSHDELLASIPDEHPGPEKLLRRGTEARRLAECLFSLTTRQQRAITLAFYYGLSHREIATKLERPVGTVKTWIRRGLDRLRVGLEAPKVMHRDSAELRQRITPEYPLVALPSEPFACRHPPEVIVKFSG